MEAFLLLVDALVMLCVAFMGLRDDRRPANSPERSLFRMVGDRLARTEGVEQAGGGSRRRTPVPNQTRWR